MTPEPLAATLEAMTADAVMTVTHWIVRMRFRCRGCRLDDVSATASESELEALATLVGL